MAAVDASLSASQLAQLAKAQVDNFFPDPNPVSLTCLEAAVNAPCQGLSTVFRRLTISTFLMVKMRYLIIYMVINTRCGCIC